MPQELAGTSENGPAKAGTAREVISDATTKTKANFFNFQNPPLGKFSFFVSYISLFTESFLAFGGFHLLLSQIEIICKRLFEGF
ncbi:hypothetical protein TDSAC_1423 [Thermodesulfobium acidiphilum]|uniref:Uncharacterized protein n=1 Tax=Thermodesulfobium acidiphilum TaxID=1794699 RepID=A0A2R4W1U0_THEAF|nr:hypothetical protein [Thermodesulfobium acidiphilum]AWB10763.1 hypothetical protein TDSAC_1423 [Thermodesulfobium acidiphilum]